MACGPVSTRRKLWKELHARYRLDDADTLFTAFWHEWCRGKSEPERSQTGRCFETEGEVDEVLGAIGEELKTRSRKGFTVVVK